MALFNHSDLLKNLSDLLNKKTGNYFFSSKGFTLIEILISIAIISLIGAVFFPNLRKFNSDQQYRNETLSVKNDIKNVQNMSTTGIRCSSTLAATSWSLVLGVGANITTNQRANCISTALVPSVVNLTSDIKTSINVQSSTCGAGTTSIELKFDKNGFSYSCNANPTFTSGTFNLQLQNKKNTGQNTTIIINGAGVISQN